MKVTYNWLKDFVDIALSPQALADTLTMAGLEVKSIEEAAGDVVFEIEITSNRPDWLSIIGVAREVAAITGKKLKVHNPKLPAPASKTGIFKITIEDKKDCPLYTAKIISGVNVGQSPEWLRKRLELVGCRSVNNVVDITNYILFEYGEPLHAFDLDALSDNEVMVRRAKKGEKITTIDGQQLALNPDILMIADKEKAVAVAGIMGGKDTEVSMRTTNVLLEAAVFDPIVVRRGKRTLGLSSESAYRFERGVALEVVEQASLRAAQLITELAGGKMVLAKSSTLSKPKTGVITLDIPRAQKTLGVTIPPAKIKNILANLGFTVKAKGKNAFVIDAPSFRGDVHSDTDLVEEIARIFGYENIPTTLPAVRPQKGTQETRDLVTLTKNALVGLGLHEAITYSLINRDLLRAFKVEAKPVEILNPLSKDQEILRPVLIPSLLRSVAHNLNQKQEYVNLFEVASVFLSQSSEPREELHLAIALAGTRAFLTEQGLVKEEAQLLHLKGALETLFERLGISIKDCDFNTGEQSAGVAIYIKQEKVGEMRMIPREILEELDIKIKNVCVLEVSLEKVFVQARLLRKFVAPPKYPDIIRDISFVLQEQVSVQEVLQAMQEKAGPLLRSIKISDYYKGKQIPSGFRGLTVSCLYRSDERTLTEEEVTPLNAALCILIKERFGAATR